MTIIARLLKGSTVVTETPLTFSGQTSVYVGVLHVAAACDRIEVVAMQPERGNFGEDSKAIAVVQK
jgi:hypothetical protein